MLKEKWYNESEYKDEVDLNEYLKWCEKYELNCKLSLNFELFYFKDDMGFYFDTLPELISNKIIDEKQIRAIRG